MLNLLRDLRFLPGALKLWRRKRVQTALSSLGIVVGVCGLVLVIALGEGARHELEAALGTLGAGSIVVRQRADDSSLPALSMDRIEAAQRLLGAFLSNTSVLDIRHSSAASSEARLETARVIGTDRSYRQIFRLSLHSGRFLSDLDVHQQKRVCVLGWHAGQSLFPRGQVVGRELRLDAFWCRVVGWLKPSAYKVPKLEALGLSEIDQVIFTPVTAFSGRAEDGALDELILQFDDETNMTAALGTVRRIIGFGRDEAALNYIVPIELLRQKQKLQQVFQYTLLGIAALMLVVGGVGIMNMMMVNVFSRRAEIGLRRAIGATRRDIIAQFVTESSIIALVGGVGGVVLGFFAAALVDLGTHWPMEFSVVAALIGFTTSVATGVIFGSYPALQAASLSPVRSLHDL